MAPLHSNGLPSFQQQSGVPLANRPNEVLLRQATNGTGPHPQQTKTNPHPPLNPELQRQPNGTINGGLKDVLPARPRLLGVEEALKYSPFSSIVPFSPDVIPIPSAHLHAPQPLFPSPSEQQMARQPLEYLNEEIARTNGQSSIAQQVTNELKPYLDPNTITDFRFKGLKGFGRHLKSTNARMNGSTSTRVPAPAIGHFAKTMLQATNLANGYPTPKSLEQTLSATKSKSQKLAQTAPPNKGPSNPPKLGQSISRPKASEASMQQQQQPPLTPQPQVRVHNDLAFTRNVQLSAKGAHQQASAHSPPMPMVVVPLSSTPKHPSELSHHVEPTAKGESEPSKKRKRESEARLESNLSQTKDQRAAADETFRQFQDLIDSIFEAEDRSQLDGLDNTSSLESQYFTLATHSDREVLTLSPSVQILLESLLLKLTKLGRCGDIPVEHLQHLQRLCEGSLASAESLDLHIDANSGAEGFASWILALEVADAGLRSARTTLRIMTCGREEKHLFPEEHLQSLLGVVKNALDNVIVPIIEARSSGSTSAMFEGASDHKKVISQLLFDTTKIMALLTKLLAQVEMAEIVINTVEFFVTPLLFVENAPSEKDSLLGIQKFESLRREAMNLIAVVFSRYTKQRTFLLGEILTSFQKLPVNDRHARQYKLVEGKSIMLVSALIMQLVQISATKATAAEIHDSKQRKLAVKEMQGSGSGSDRESSEAVSESPQSDESDASNEPKPSRKPSALQKLNKSATLLVDNATKSAHYVITFLVQRASNTAKSSESPHRQHLDMFVSDLISVLGIPEWPAAELLLRLVYASCRQIAETPKSLAPAKSMALELLGMLGSAISDLVSSTQHASKSLDNQESGPGESLRQMFEDYVDGSLEHSDLVKMDGPYHAIVEYLGHNDRDGTQYNGARSYLLAQWGKAASGADLKPDAKTQDLVAKLHTVLSSTAQATPDTISTMTVNQSRVAYALTILNMGLCRQSDYILKILLDQIASEQISVRTRSLKSVDKMLEGDPSVLDRARNVKGLISNCANDASPMVRDSALTLIGKCIILRPTLEPEFLRLILKLTDDPAIGIRKRSMKMLKETYLRNSDQNVKTAVADSLLQRVKDPDTSVSDLACQIFEDLWLSPLYTVPELIDASVQNKVDLRSQTRLIVATIRRGEKVATVFAHLLKAFLSAKAKNATANYKICKLFVATAFDIMVDNFQEEERIEQRHVLQTLTVFAMANPRLFTPDHLQSLQPYVANLSSKDDHEVFQSIVIIFRCVLPIQSSVQHGLLTEIQKALLQSVAKLGKEKLNEVAACLWTINGILRNPESLLRLVVSVLKNLHNMRDKTFRERDQVDDLKRVKKYVQIAGYFGKHCDFESSLQTIQGYLPWWKGQSVAGLIVQSIHPFTTKVQPLSLRIEAFDSIGLLCQSWPFQFTQERNSNDFQEVLRRGEPEIQTIVLSSFREFFARIDRQAEEKIEETSEGVNGSSGEKLGASMTANDGDGASALIAQRFLKDILRIALASQDASALTATEVIASINRQGLVHPKESGPALVALETSTNAVIADVAFREHRLLHQQHESMFEREYMRAIQEAFRYQRDIVGDTLGYTTHPFASKLSATFEIIKTSKSKYQKKFISNFCSKTDFDILKMDMSGSPPIVLQFSRFLMENLAFFEYGRLDELLHTISCMEKIVADTGSGIAHSISTEILNITVQSMPEASVSDAPQVQVVGEIPKPSLDHSRLRLLTTAAIILDSLWDTRTYLRRLYGLSAGQQKRDAKNKTASKDLNKVPCRAQGITGDKLTASIAERVIALDSEDSMIQQCKDFVELLSVDNEVKVAAESEENSEQIDTPSVDGEEPDTPMSGRSQGIKRKGSASIAGTPMKKKRGRPSLKRKKSGKSVNSDQDWD